MYKNRVILWWDYPVLFIQRDELVTACAGITLGNLVPVDDIPPSVEIIRATILILEIVGMLPHIIAQNRNIVLYQGTVLVSGGNDFKFATLVEDEPGPTRTEA